MIPLERKPRNPLPPGHTPSQGTPRRVRDGDDWHSLAVKNGLDAKALIHFNFQTTDPAEVNFYLRTKVGCKQTTFDGKNWKFSSGDSPGIIFIPPKVSYAILLPVPHFRGTKANSCWHDAARMIFQYRKGGDANPIAPVWAADTGLSPNDFAKLSKELGLKPISVPPESLTLEFLAEALRKYGPLWAAGKWNGAEHVVVITGLDGNGNVYVNDPSRPSPRVEPFEWFDSRLYRTPELDNSLLYLP